MLEPSPSPDIQASGVILVSALLLEVSFTQFKPEYAVAACNTAKQFSNYMRIGISYVWIAVQLLQEFFLLIPFQQRNLL